MPNWVADVALLSQAIDVPLTYRVPDTMQSQLQIGCAVIAPLQSKMVSGIVLTLREADGNMRTLKPLHSLIDPQPALDTQHMALARWIADEYHAPLGRCCALMVPPGFTPRSAFVYSINAARPIPQKIAPVESAILNMLKVRGAMIESKLARALMQERGWRGALKNLMNSGAVMRASTLETPRAEHRRTTLAQLIVSEAALEIALNRLREQNNATAQRRIAALDYLRQRNGLAWADWLMAETSATRADVNWLEERGYIMLGDATRWRDPLADIDFVPKSPPPLTSDQQAAWQAISNQMSVVSSQILGDRSQMSDGSAKSKIQNPKFLLRGVTGSGKTEIYMRAVEAALQRGRGAIILVPEISLTPQTARRFLERFPGKVALIHSQLKPGERMDTWRRIRAGELPIVIGARSALFAPLADIGLIVLDEEHESSYKQDKTPHYDARRVALQFAQQHNATLIYGSATPSLEAWHMAQRGELTFLELPNRVRGHVNRISDQQARLGLHSHFVSENEAVAYQALPDVQVLDMRAELRGGNSNMFSGALSQALRETLERGEQAILFLNRRGTASCVVCRDCGHAMRCPNDDVPLTLHTGVRSQESGVSPQPPTFSTQLRCHYCDHTESVPTVCPTCRSSRIKFIGIGTQRIEHAIHEQFPKARVVRWDKDTSSARGAADQLLQRFVNQQADVLIGTQMIAKGLDLPMVTLVGVVLADVGLFLPDFRASERVFNLIEQVAGRAGRGLLRGRVIVQTYNPDHPAIAFAAQHDVRGFVEYELQQRRNLDLPPFTRLVRIEVNDTDNAQARAQCEHIARQLRQRLTDPAALIGPAPAYFGRRQNQFRWQLIARTDSPSALLSRLDLPRGCVVDVDPLSVL